MSLVGNLEDLSLGDLLQIVSLSQKSGVLALESARGAGQIVFRSGLVHAAGIKGRSPDLRALLVGTGLVDAAAFEAALTANRSKPAELAERVAVALGLDPDQVEAGIRKAAEGAIFEMFSWTSGEFSFDARREDGEDLYPCLRSGVNAQYLAMEGMRLRDEQSRGGPAPEVDLAEELFFGSEALEVDPEAELELEGDETARHVAVAVVAHRAVENAREVVQAEPVEAHVEAIAAEIAEPAPEPTLSPQSRPIVVVEPDAVALEWVKRAIEGHFVRIHVFQRAEQGLARIRQYLIRGEIPFVLIALSAPIDPLSGIHGLPDFVKRLRTQAPRIVVVGLREGGEERVDPVPGYLDAVFGRPTRKQLRTSQAASELAARAVRLAQELEQIVVKRA